MIRTYNLTRSFGRVEALRGLTMTVPVGSVFALVGPNGAGKTTCIRLLLNILRPTTGHAKIAGVESTRLGASDKAQLGYVSENMELPGWMTVSEFLAYARPFYPTWDDERATALLQAYELPADRRLRALSRGMKMKAMLAAALAHRPKLLILDEPFSGLDVLVREDLIESVLDQMAESTVLIASHDLAEIESFASHVAYLNDGALEFTEEMGTLADRFRDVEVTLEAPPDPPAAWPSSWLNPQTGSNVICFTESRFAPGETERAVAELFPGLRSLAVRNMPLRSI
ncbi:MAG: ABC transporter ATP-binding protein, partial [Acidobacteria bacterium]|nr:ABC transporter ATP-binding protein [Acidobacteriota bacterium]